MKAIMISIKPKWCAKIMNGEKTIEVRKNKALYKAIQTLFSMYGYVEFYGYCTKSSLKVSGKYGYKKELVVNGNVVNGKVLFKFRCYKVEEHKDFACMFPYSNLRYNKSTCLTEEEIEDYGFVDGKGYVPLYAIHIADLEIFDKPKELSEFEYYKPTKIKKLWARGHLTNAPQNYCYLEV